MRPHALSWALGYLRLAALARPSLVFGPSPHGTFSRFHLPVLFDFTHFAALMQCGAQLLAKMQWVTQALQLAVVSNWPNRCHGPCDEARTLRSSYRWDTSSLTTAKIAEAGEATFYSQEA